MYVLVYLGDTWKDGGAMDIRRELEGLTLGVGCGLRRYGYG